MHCYKTSLYYSVCVISPLHLEEIKEHQDICLENMVPFTFPLEILTTKV